MKTNLTRVGEDLALILDSKTLEALGIDEDTALEITQDQAGFHIRRSDDDHRERLLVSARRVMDLHDEAFRRLDQ